jgi:tetratricopeptide (TPR) repeat protein
MAEGRDEDLGAAGPDRDDLPRPAGEVYDWYVRAVRLLDTGNAGAAAQLLEHAHDLEPESLSVREALARSLFDSGRYIEAAFHFESLVGRNPDDDYARFGLGLALSRQGDQEAALEHLALAVAMRPDRDVYVRALQQARATVRFREVGDGGTTSPGAGDAQQRSAAGEALEARDEPTLLDNSQHDDDGGRG